LHCSSCTQDIGGVDGDYSGWERYILSDGDPGRTALVYVIPAN
jgi:hypothetical protein